MCHYRINNKTMSISDVADLILQDRDLTAWEEDSDEPVLISTTDFERLGAEMMGNE